MTAPLLRWALPRAAGLAIGSAAAAAVYALAEAVAHRAEGLPIVLSLSKRAWSLLLWSIA